MGGLGSGGAGASSHGSGGVAVVAAQLAALNAVDVEFSDVMRQDRTLGESDALRASAYTLAALVPSSDLVRLSQHVETVDGRRVRVFFDGPLPAALFELEVDPELESVTGVSMGPARFAEVSGIPAPSADERSELASREGRDLRNDGTLRIDAAGDLATEEGVAYLRKRLLRRATTAISGFFHLPEYGFAEPLKTRITADLLRRMQSRALAQVSREPGVRDARVTLAVFEESPFVVILTIRATTSAGAAVEASAPVSLEEG